MLAAIQPADAQSKDFNVPAQPATTAIPELARQAGIQILVSEPLVRGKRLAAVTGPHSINEALAILLQGTGLIATSKDGATYTVTLSTSISTSNAAADNAKEVGKKSSRDFRVAEVDQGQTANASSVGGQPSNTQISGSPSTGLAEIIVTAQKRSERLQDVPVPVTTLSAQSLLVSNQLRIADYFTQVPGLNFSPDAFGGPQISIRGITSGGFANPGVGIVVDDVPFGSSTGLGGGQLVPDFDPSDLERIEVLRGPQGTLYGASSIGGLLKYVTVDPTTGAFSARVQIGLSSVQNGAELGYNVRAAVNIPLSDTLAARASAFTRIDPGYIDDPALSQRGVNKAVVEGGRLSVLWAPIENVSLKVNAVIQHSALEGSAFAEVQSGLRNLQRDDALPGLGGYVNDNQFYSATLKAKLGKFDLTSVSGYNIDKHSDSSDLTFLYGSIGFPPPANASSATDYFRTSKFTQEIRLLTPTGERVEWLAGLFYTREANPDDVTYYYANLAPPGSIVGTALYGTFPTTFAEYAAFTDLTFHITDRFDIQFGGRESQNRQSYWSYTGGPLNGSGPPIVTPKLDTKDHAFTYLVTPRLKLSPDVMLYARFASGYRPGGPNSNSASSVPPSYRSDSTNNYELGAKADAFDHKLSFDASLYRIDWRNMQILLLDPAGAGYTSNAGKAKSQGVELSVQAVPLPDLSVKAWVAFSEAVLTQSFPAASLAYGVVGDSLPNSSRFSGNVSLDENFGLPNSVSSFVGASVSYVGDRQGQFQSLVLGQPQLRQSYPGYARIDLHGGIQYQSWTMNVFANNVANKRGILVGGADAISAGVNPVDYIQPRTIGLSVVKTF
jgi:outer membrane receptor protein involved in Fe transport